MNEKFTIEESADYFGPLYKYVSDPDITDIDLVEGSSRVWLTDTDNHRFSEAVENLGHSFVEEFSVRVSNTVSLPFHKHNPILEAETPTLRITIVHESVSIAGRAISIRKSHPTMRMTRESMLAESYATPEILDFLEECVRGRANIVFCGEPGVGKTECAKYFAQFIPSNDRIVTIEDTPEWHLSDVFGDGDIVELRVGAILDYTQAIKTSLRLNPKWMMVSEVRSSEVRYLIESLSTGVRGMTTLHTDDVRSLPDRIVNMIGDDTMAGRIRNDVYSFIDVGVLIRRGIRRGAGGVDTICRYIDQIAIYERNDGENTITLLYDEGRATGEKPPARFSHRVCPEREVRKFAPHSPIPAVNFAERRGTYLGEERQII